MNPQVSVIIVSYNTCNKTIDCLESVFTETKDISFEVIVSDNGSTDGTINEIEKKYPQVKLVKNGSNIGFGKANNIALEIAKGDFVFYLNSDTILMNNAIKIFYDFWHKNASHNLGALGTNLIDRNGNIIHSAATFPSYHKICISQLQNNILNVVKAFITVFHLEEKYYSHSVNKSHNNHFDKYVGEVDYVTGADLFLKNNEKARFNDEYFMYYEETELEYKLKNNGFSIQLIDGPKIIHDQSVNNGFVIYKIVDIFKEDSSIIYAKNILKSRGILLRLLIRLNRLNPMIKRVANKATSISKSAKGTL